MALFPVWKNIYAVSSFRQTGFSHITNGDRFSTGGTGSDGNRELWCKEPSEKE